MLGRYFLSLAESAQTVLVGNAQVNGCHGCTIPLESNVEVITFPIRWTGSTQDADLGRGDCLTHTVGWYYSLNSLGDEDGYDDDNKECVVTYLCQ